MPVNQITPVDPWPERKLPKERFDEKVQIAMNQMSTMIEQLNSIVIPVLNDVAADDISGLRTSIQNLTTQLTQVESALTNKAGTSNASQTAAGLMSAADKAKLDGIAEGAQVNVTQTSVTGNAGTATKLANPRAIQTNLASGSAANFDGSSDINPGITGTLPIGNGGTGATSASAALSGLGGIAKSGDRGSLAGSEIASAVSGSQTITASSPDCINIAASGGITLTFTAAAATVRSVKAISITANSASSLTVSGAVWANKGSAPTWGNASTVLVILAHFVGGRVVLSVADNTQ